MDFRHQALNILREKTALVIAGGGTRGYSVCGNLERLSELGLPLSNFKYVTGSSVGSIIATAIACNGTVEYIKEKMNNIDLQALAARECILVEGFNLLKNYGLHETDEIDNLMGSVLQDLVGNKNITLLELYELTKIHLTITYLSLNYNKTIYADYLTEPDTLVRSAVVKSSTIPLYYEAHFEGRGASRSVAVDGGTANNYPMNVARKQVNPINILGIKFISTADIDETKDMGIPRNVVDYLYRIVNILRDQALRIHVEENDWKNTMKIDVKNITSTSFDLTQEQKDWLFNQGRESVNKHILDLEQLLKDNKYPYVLTDL